MELLTSLFLLCISISILFIGGWTIIQGSVILARLSKINKAVIGFTIISLATSLPELLISVKAALINSNDFAIANVIGSNICNIAFILGISTLIKPLYASKIERNLSPFFIISTLLLFFIIYNNQIIGFSESFLMLIILLIINFIVIYDQKNSYKLNESSNKNTIKIFRKVIYINNKINALVIIIIGGVFLHFGSSLLLENAITIAGLLGVEERVIAISFVAIGTSIPELATTIIAISKKEFELIIGNILGSNIFNILAILGFSGLITDISIENQASIFTDSLFMLIISLLIIYLFNFSKAKGAGRIVGFTLIVSYISYLLLIFN